MMRADTFNLHVDPVRTKMTSMEQIPIYQVCSLYKSKAKWIITDKKILQVCSTDKIRSEIVIVNESSTQERKSKTIHKSINKNKVKYAIDEILYEEPLVTDNPFINEPSYFDLFECGKNFLNNIDAACERACVETSKDKYYTEMRDTLTDYNDRNNTPLSNAKIREAIRKVTEEE